MIELPVTLTSTGGAVSFAYPVPLGYTKNKGVYRLLVTAEGEWDGLTIRCFWHLPGVADPASSLVQDGAVDVPASVTAHPGNGCITFEGSDGVKTVTSADLRYRVGSNSGTEDGTMPEPGTPAWEQLVSETAVAVDAVQKQIGNLDDLTTKAKETLVAAINEAARNGSGGAGSITMRTDGGYIQYSTDDGSTWENLVALAELKGEPGAPGAAGKSAYQYAVEGGYTGTEEEFAAKIAEELPNKLPNPNALIFTGAVTGSYDGSEPMKVNIPSGGSGSGAEKTWSLLLDETLSEDTAYIFQNLSAPVTELIIKFRAGGDGTHRDVTIFNRQGVGYGRNIATFKNVLRSDTNVLASFVIHCVAFPDLAFFRCQYNNYNTSVGDNIINASSTLVFEDENGAFNGSTNFDCISIGCWSAGNSGVFKAGTRVKVYGKI